MQAAAAIRAPAAAILAANASDVADAQARGTKGAFLDRLMLDAGRLEAMARRRLEDIAAAPRSRRPRAGRSGRGRTACGIERVAHAARA